MNKGTITVKSNVQWGKRYRDTITGFEGVATGYCAYVSGCDQVLLNGGLNKDGDKVNSMWFDADRLAEIDTGKIPDKDRGLKGPDTPAPVRN
jgi:hypothetical protein